MKLETGTYFGAIKNQFKSEGIIITQSSYLPDQCIPKHFHDNPYLCFVYKGHYKEIIGSKELQCSPGDFIVHPSSFEHRNRIYDRAAMCINIELENSVNSFKSGVLNFSEIIKIRNTACIRIIEQMTRELKRNDHYSWLSVEGQVLELLAQIGREQKYDAKTTKSAKWVQTIISVLNDELDQPLHLKYLSSIVELNPSYLSREFKKCTGQSLSDYLLNVRIRKSQELLKRPYESIPSIALQCGFSDQSHFTRRFKAVTGSTPLKFRNSMNR